MKWIKKGLIYNVDNRIKWANNTVMTPTPFLVNEDTIRIYASFRDNQGRGRIGYIDVESSNPSHIIKISRNPVLDIGVPGMFDDNGIILGDIVRVNDEIYMYYVGFQMVKNVKFLAYSGLAISKDGGNIFLRYQPTPIMDRVSNALFIRAIHSVIKEDDIFRVWYSVGNGWEYINGLPYPQYDIRYVESKNGIYFEDSVGFHCIGVQGNEYRIGRPRVIKRSEDNYEMRYTFDTKNKEYISGIAFSKDGINWERQDNNSGISKSNSGWDSEMLCYPVEIETKYGIYLFYNGNGMGATGVGYAKLI